MLVLPRSNYDWFDWYLTHVLRLACSLSGPSPGKNIIDNIRDQLSDILFSSGVYVLGNNNNLRSHVKNY